MNSTITTCQDLYLSHEKCQFVSKYCTDFTLLNSYLSFLYCSYQDYELLGLILIGLWTILLFIVYSRAAMNYLCPNLASISGFLHIPQSIAGVTLAAFSNSAPDLFGTFSSFQAHSSDLALGELLGAANFITMVVVGSVAIQCPFKMPKWPFIRDVVCFLIANFIFLFVLWTGKVALIHSIGFILYYILYVVVVLTGNWIHQCYFAKKNVQGTL